MPIRSALIVGLCVCVYAGCELAPTTPTSPAPATSAGTNQNTNAWSPCLVVQSPAGPPFSVQMQAARTLQRAGKTSWLRLNTHLDGTGVEYHLEARRMGL